MNKINILNEKDAELYKKYKMIIDGIYTEDDFDYICNKLNVSQQNPMLIPIMYSYFRSKNTCKGHKIGLSTIYNLLKSANSMQYYDDIIETYGSTIKHITDSSQINVLNRFLRNKAYRPYEQKDRKTTIKACPHCRHEFKTFDKEKEYVVCGYLEDGFDWQGCGKDWCFKCNKKLCKAWHTDNLYLEDNRHHNSKCCLYHAKKHNVNYIDDYCHCVSEYVNRQAVK